jgi:hypothetical protein
MSDPKPVLAPLSGLEGITNDSEFGPLEEAHAISDITSSTRLSHPQESPSFGHAGLNWSHDKPLFGLLPMSSLEAAQVG